MMGFIFGGGIACYANSFLLTDVMRVFILFYLMPVWTTIFEFIYFQTATKMATWCKSFIGVVRTMDSFWQK